MKLIQRKIRGVREAKLIVQEPSRGDKEIPVRLLIAGSSDEPGMGITDVIKGDVKKKIHLARMERMNQFHQGFLAAELFINLEKIRGIVLMVGRGEKERGEV